MEIVSKSKIPPQQIRRFTFSLDVSCMKQSTALTNLFFPSLFILFLTSPSIDCQTHPGEFHSMTLAAMQFKAQALSRRSSDIRRDTEETLQRFPHHSPKFQKWKFQRGSYCLRHSSKGWLLDCSILNEDFFSSGDRRSLPGARRCRLLLCGSLQGAGDEEKMKNDTVGKLSTLVVKKSTCSLQSIAYLDLLPSREGPARI